MPCLILVLLFLLSPSYAHYKPNPQVLVVSYQKGSHWDAKRPLKKQEKIGEHIIFLKKLFHDNKILFASHDKDRSFGEYWLKVPNKKQGDMILANDPAIKAKVLTYELREATVTMIGKNNHEH